MFDDRSNNPFDGIRYEPKSARKKRKRYGKSNNSESNYSPFDWIKYETRDTHRAKRRESVSACLPGMYPDIFNFLMDNHSFGIFCAVIFLPFVVTSMIVALEPHAFLGQDVTQIAYLTAIFSLCLLIFGWIGACFANVCEPYELTSRVSVAIMVISIVIIILWLILSILAMIVLLAAIGLAAGENQKKKSEIVITHTETKNPFSF